MRTQPESASSRFTICSSLPAIVAFSVDGESYFALFQAGTPEADKQYTKDVISIVNSIASLKSKSEED